MSGFAKLPVSWALASNPLSLPSKLSARGFCPVPAGGGLEPAAVTLHGSPAGPVPSGGQYAEVCG